MLKKFLKYWRNQVWLKHRDILIQKSELKYLFWEATLNCNFLCKHCWSNAWEKHIKETLSTQEIKNAFLDISNNFDSKKITIAITWWEPLLRKDLFEVMEYASSLWFYWWMVTNWYLINENLIEKMKKSWMKTIDISIDWLEKNHDNFRNKIWSFNRNINALKLLQKADFLNPLRITTTVSKQNIWELEEMYNYFSKIWLKDWRLLNIDPIWRAENINKELLLSKKQMDILFNFIKEKRKKWKINITTWCAHFLWDDYEDEIRNHFFFCGTWINVGSILHNWDIFVCPNVPRIPKLIQWNIKKDLFSDIWKNKFKYFRNKYRIEDENCKKCDYYEECLWGSFHTYDFKNKKQKVCFMDK